MSRLPTGAIINTDKLTKFGFGPQEILGAIAKTYDLLDRIDVTLADAGVFPLSQTVELANLSSMIGNIFSGSLAQISVSVR